MSVLLDTIPDVLFIEDDDDDEGVSHFYCECSPQIAICGIDLPVDGGYDSPDDFVVDCVVCADLESLPCPRCGALE